jgi:glycosyltransferase involved in cell wall biosynthesis
MVEERIKKYDLLAITNVWTGAIPFFYDNKKEFKGMPAFSNVFISLLDDDRVNKIHLILFENPNAPQINIPDIYNSKLKIYNYTFSVKNKTSNIFLLFKVFYDAYKLIKKNKVKKLLGFGSLAGVTAILGNFLNIPDFRRLYGSFLINEINKSKLELFLKHPLEFLCFALPGKGLIITNDGTKGNIVFEKVGNKTLKFHFLLNGVDPLIEKNISKPVFDLPQIYLSYVARINDWKRQHLLVLALNILQKKGVKLPPVFIVGPFDQNNYVDFLHKMISDFQLSTIIFVKDGVKTSETNYILKNSLFTFSLYHTSNLGNVFLESLKLGVPVIALNDTSSLDIIDKNAFCEILSDNPEVIADSIEGMLHNDDKRISIGMQAKRFADSNITTWAQRSKFEIDLYLN